MWKQSRTIIGAVLLLSAFTTAVLGFNGHFATKSEMQQVSSKVDKHLLEQERAAIQKRVWDMEDRWTDRFWKEHGRGPETNDELVAFMSQQDRETYRDLLDQLRKLDERIKDA